MKAEGDMPMVPPDEPEPTPAEWWADCAHGEACRMQLARLRGRDVCEGLAHWQDDLAEALGCSEMCGCLEVVW